MDVSGQLPSVPALSLEKEILLLTEQGGPHVGLKKGLDDLEKWKIFYPCREWNGDSSAVQPVRSHNSEYGIPDVSV
jgi:hypothetical protein